jgi:hypothetical protein
VTAIGRKMMGWPEPEIADQKDEDSGCSKSEL